MSLHAAPINDWPPPQWLPWQRSVTPVWQPWMHQSPPACIPDEWTSALQVQAILRVRPYIGRHRA